MNHQRIYPVLLILLLLGFGLFYSNNIAGYLIHDDEGAAFYEAWRLQQGERPGQDFIAEQQPLFLLLGRLAVDVNGRSPATLRLLSAVQVLLGAFFLSLVVYKIWDGPAAALTLGLILSSGLVYEQARLYRPDPMMLAWEMVGLAFVLLAVQGGQRRFWLLAGIVYGLASLFKLFGVFPLLGLTFYFLDALWRRRRQGLEVFVSGVVFAAAFLATMLIISVALYRQVGFYYLEPLSYHLEPNQSYNLLSQVKIVLINYGFLFLVNMVFLFIPALWLLNRPKEWRNEAVYRLLLWQLLAPLILLAVSRRIYLRYYIFMIPVLAILLAAHFRLAFSKIEQERPRFVRFIPVVIMIMLAFASVTTRFKLGDLMRRHESGTLALAQLLSSHTDPDDLVLADFPSINFHAGRASIPEASIINSHHIGIGVITADLLIRRIEEGPVEMVLLHVGGKPRPTHFVTLDDYDAFQAYLDEQFLLLTEFDRSGELFEIYQRK